MKIGIFFGGASREREIAFAGGRTVYDNLNKNLFTPVPIFVDSLNNLILLDWQFIYKGTIRDFYPPNLDNTIDENGFQHYIESIENLSTEKLSALIEKVGKKILIQELPNLIDFAFLSLHGAFGEDGTIQGMLQWLGIPYSGSGILPSAIGMNKAAQKQLMVAKGFHSPKYWVVKKQDIDTNSIEDIYRKVISEIGNYLVIKPANQGSSVGASILQNPDYTAFETALLKAFFIKKLKKDYWQQLTEAEKIVQLKQIIDIRDGVGLPCEARLSNNTLNNKILYNANELLKYLNEVFETQAEIALHGIDTECEVMIEQFIHGKEFSCIVIQDEQGKPIALPPTEIVKGKELFDYRSKYMPGLSRKVTPIQATTAQIDDITNSCEQLFNYLKFDVYARIDGFLTENNEVFLNDPNTTSGMLPSSFFFHQAAEIGWSPSVFLTFIIRTSLQQRIIANNNALNLQKKLNALDIEIAQQNQANANKKRIAVLMGGYSSERHISVESGRNIFEKLNSSAKYQPIPIFLTGNNEEHHLFQIPINIMLKDNADDIKEKIEHFNIHPSIEKIKSKCNLLTEKYMGHTVSFAPKKIEYADLKNLVDEVFIALHGRPGEDGAVQAKLDALHIPYNGSGVHSSQITINKFDTLQLLKQHDFVVTEQYIMTKSAWNENNTKAIENLLSKLQFPIIAKPIDDGCSSAVKKIANEIELKAFIELMFRDQETLLPEPAAILGLMPKEEFPRKNNILFEALINKQNAKQFLEITVGLLTHKTEDGTIMYEIFEPSEALADGAILSVEEKFLAGQGQNITPARFSTNEKDYKIIAKQVKKTIEDAAKLLNIEGYSRIDAFVRIYDDLKADTIIVEANSLPGMTPATCIYHQAAINGYKPFDFIDRILMYGLEKKN